MAVFGASLLDLFNLAKELIDFVLLYLLLLEEEDVDSKALSGVGGILYLGTVSLRCYLGDLTNDSYRVVSEGVLCDFLMDLCYRHETTGLHLRNHLQLFLFFKI